MLEPHKHTAAAIVGLGNVLLTDDGVGVHAVRRLREARTKRLRDEAPEGVIIAEVGTAVMDALDLFENVEHVVAIDAVRAGGPPGSIYSFSMDDVEAQKTVSAHELGIAEAMKYLPAGLAPKVSIIGVEPAVIDYGVGLSPTVQAVLDEVVRKALAAVSQSMERILPTTGV